MKFILHLLVYIVFISCNGTANTSDQKAKDSVLSVAENKGSVNYDLTKPSKTWDLPEELKEISGNTWVDKDHLVVIEDLHPNLYLLKLDNVIKIEKTIPFEAGEDKKFDIEDVVIVNDVVY